MMSYLTKKGLIQNTPLSFNTLHGQLCQRLDYYGIDLVRIALAIVFIWFGALKVVGLSPAQLLVEKTIFWFPPKSFVPFLGIWEVVMGLGLIIKRFIPFTILLLLVHMTGTFLPLFILSKTCFDSSILCPTMEGQYILKNLVLIAGALAVAGKYQPKRA